MATLSRKSSVVRWSIERWRGTLGLGWYNLFWLAVLGAFAFAALFPGVVVSGDPLTQDLESALKPPFWASEGSLSFPFGTDELGRDIFARVVYSVRLALAMGLFGVLLGGGIGSAMGLIAGFYGRALDAIIMRLVDISLAIPMVLVALLLAMTIGPGMVTILVAVTAIIWARFARLARGECLRIREEQYVTAARAIGATRLRILVRHVLPNMLDPLLVLATLQMGWVVTVEAILSFLGAGIPQPTPTLGGMVADGRGYIFDEWWISLLPGAALVVLVVSLNIAGELIGKRLDQNHRADGQAI